MRVRRRLMDKNVNVKTIKNNICINKMVSRGTDGGHIYVNI